ncbi:hypothetical protein [Clostridium sp. Cult1]|uniref:hypothetical protein n=1 Tax=Clostridium sp. Cult1 TaxID=2079002 RepID=UPI001F3CF2E8|nr:hypothetical protein [Clostridium sp. Cult1]MCF6464188.1 hypothetical protein [Clostridium sp. Cult1]
METLNDIEKQILIDLYDRDIKNMLEIKIEQERYKLSEEGNNERIQELVYYLEKLERLKYIEIKRKQDGKFYTSGGRSHPKYRNNAIFDINDKDIHIVKKGIEYVIELRKTPIDKMKDWLKGFLKDTGTEVGKEIIKYIVIFAIGFLLGKIT